MLGYKNSLGDAKMEVMDCDYPDAGYSDKQPGRANDYKERQNRIVTKEAKEIKSQGYKGRYD